MLEPTSTFAFSFLAATRPLLAALGIRSATSWVAIDDVELDVRFGPWRVSTPLTNVASAEPGGELTLPKGLGPRLSLVDRGLTFGSDTTGAVCIRFLRPVPGGDPFGVLRHPGLTVTVDTPELLAARLHSSCPHEVPMPSHHDRGGR